MPRAGFSSSSGVKILRLGTEVNRQNIFRPASGSVWSLQTGEFGVAKNGLQSPWSPATFSEVLNVGSPENIGQSGSNSQMSYLIEAIPAKHSNREEMVQYLAGFEGDDRGSDFWRRRLSFWWDQNPFSQASLERGWLLRHRTNVVGFFGLIPMEYVYRAHSIPAIAATTWRVDREHRGESFGMFLKFQRVAPRHIVVDSTPNEVVLAVLKRFHYQFNTEAWEYFFPIRHAECSPASVLINFAHFFMQRTLPGDDLRIVTDPGTHPLAREFMDSERLEKRITPEYLKWYCASPDMEKRFVGCLNPAGQVTSYLLLVRERFKKIDAVTVIDDFTTQRDNRELLALVGAVCRQPSILGAWSGARLLVWRSFEGGLLSGKSSLGTVRRRIGHTQFFQVPAEFSKVPKRFVVAEGDLGY